MLFVQPVGVVASVTSQTSFFEDKGFLEAAAFM